MTREEAIEIIQKLIGRFKSDSRTYKALEMAIKALSQEPTNTWSIKDVADTFKKHGLIREQEPCDDAISREAAINIASLHCLTIDESVKAIKNLPSVTQKSGEWIPVSERLPEEGQEILFSTKTGRVHSGKYHDDDSANQWYSHKDKCRAWNNVVNAWMPLPKPFEPQESEE